MNTPAFVTFTFTDDEILVSTWKTPESKWYELVELQEDQPSKHFIEPTSLADSIKTRQAFVERLKKAGEIDWYDEERMA